MEVVFGWILFYLFTQLISFTVGCYILLVDGDTSVLHLTPSYIYKHNRKVNWFGAIFLYVILWVTMLGWTTISLFYWICTTHALEVNDEDENSCR